MSGPEYDPEFEAYLRGHVRLDRRLPRSFTRLEPPAELDRMVIGMARGAIQPLPNAPLFRAPRWAVPLAMAASLLASFTLMLDVGLRQGYREPVSEALIVELTNPTAAPARPAPASAPAAALAAAAGAGPAVPESSRMSLSRMIRQKLAATRASPSHQRMAASAPGAGRAALADAAEARAAAPVVASAAPEVADATTHAQVARQAVPAVADAEEARYRGVQGPAPIRLASVPSEMDTVIVIGTRIPGGSFGTR